jgi:ribosomal protein S18 acetylase RimI-like enzyme
MTATRTFRIRTARRTDAPQLAQLANALNVHEGKPPDVHTPEAILRDLLSNDGFVVLVAESAGLLAGYIVHHATYNSDLGVPGLWGVDLYVHPSMRRHGIARALTAGMAAYARAHGLRSLWWNVRAENVRARAAYAAMGAYEEDTREVHLDGAALEQLAEEGEKLGLFDAEDLRRVG